jgi:hypothetical protein
MQFFIVTVVKTTNFTEALFVPCRGKQGSSQLRFPEEIEALCVLEQNVPDLASEEAAVHP